MNKIATLLLATLAAATVMTTPARADFTTVDLAYEVPFAFLRMPQSANGIVTFKQCEDCEEFTVSVTPATQYVVNGEAVELADFRRIMFTVRQQSSQAGNAATVLRNLESDTTVRIAVDL